MIKETTRSCWNFCAANESLTVQDTLMSRTLSESRVPILCKTCLRVITLCPLLSETWGKWMHECTIHWNWVIFSSQYIYIDIYILPNLRKGLLTATNNKILGTEVLQQPGHLLPRFFIGYRKSGYVYNLLGTSGRTFRDSYANTVESCKTKCTPGLLDRMVSSELSHGNVVPQPYGRETSCKTYW